MKLSVVVPVYNTAEYLDECIRSIIHQTYKDIEVILVDDGSNDGSGAICDYYASNFDNFKVVHQENCGNAAARCRGGEYVTFMDSDDWIAEDMYEELMKTAEAEKCDIVSQNGLTVYDGKRYFVERTATITGTYRRGDNFDVFLSVMLYDEDRRCAGAGPSLGQKVIKKEIIDDVIKKVNKNIVLGGDAAIFYSSCLRAKSICIIEGCKYFYRVYGMSVSHTYDAANFNKIYILYQYLENDFLAFDEGNGLIEQLRKHVWYFLSMQIKQIFGLEFKDVYLFPYQCIDMGSKIILYGAGKVGQSYYEQLKRNQYCNIIAWADSKVYKGNGNIIQPMEMIGMEYSKIVVAVKSKKTAGEIIHNLIGLGVDKGKIVWAEPHRMPLL